MNSFLTVFVLAAALLAGTAYAEDCSYSIEVYDGDYLFLNSTTVYYYPPETGNLTITTCLNDNLDLEAGDLDTVITVYNDYCDYVADADDEYNQCDTLAYIKVPVEEATGVYINLGHYSPSDTDKFYVTFLFDSDFIGDIENDDDGDDSGDDDGDDPEDCPADETDPEDGDLYDAPEYGWWVAFSANEDYSVSLTTCIKENQAGANNSEVMLALMDNCNTNYDSAEYEDGSCEFGTNLPTITFNVRKGEPQLVAVNQYGMFPLYYKVHYEGRNDAKDGAASMAPLAWLIVLCIGVLLAGADRL